MKKRLSTSSSGSLDVPTSALLHRAKPLFKVVAGAAKGPPPASSSGASSSAVPSPPNLDRAPSMSIDEVCSTLDIHLARGLPLARAAATLKEHGGNLLPPVFTKLAPLPERLPRWINAVLGPQRVYAALRDGIIGQVKTKDLVVGDMVFVEAGDMVPADLRIVAADHGLAITREEARFDDKGWSKVNVQTEVETVLERWSGGQDGAAVSEAPLPADTPMHSASNIAPAASFLVSGRLVGIVVATGAGTCWGQSKALTASAAAGSSSASSSSSSAGSSSAGRVLASEAACKPLVALVYLMARAGMLVLNTAAMRPLCGRREPLYMVMVVDKDSTAELVFPIRQCLGQGHHVVLVLGPDVDPESLRPTSPLRLRMSMKTVPLASDKGLEHVVATLAEQDLIFTQGAAGAVNRLVPMLERRFPSKVVFLGTDLAHKPAMVAASVGLCRATAPAALQRHAAAVLHPSLKGLVLGLRLLYEASDVPPQ